MAAPASSSSSSSRFDIFLAGDLIMSDSPTARVSTRRHLHKQFLCFCFFARMLARDVHTRFTTGPHPLCFCRVLSGRSGPTCSL